MDSEIKLGNGTPINFRKTAKNVTYNGGTLEEPMNELSKITPYGEKLLAAENLTELRYLLQADVPMFYDDAEYTLWRPVGNPTKTSTNAKFGSALKVDAYNYLQTLEPVSLGGNPFTIQFWGYFPSTVPSGATFFSMGSAIQLKSFNTSLYLETVINGNRNSAGGTYYGGSQVFIEFGYQNGKVYSSVKGGVYTYNYTIPRDARTIKLGNASFWIDEFRILDGVCAHTGNFTPPTAKFPVTNQTISLLHFD